MTRHCGNPECPGLERDGIAPEYVDSVDACLDCGATLMRGPGGSQEKEAPRFTDYTTVFVAANVVQAQVVASVLRAAEIQVYLKGELLTSAMGELPANVSQVEVQVPSVDRERAREWVMRFEGPND